MAALQMEYNANQGVSPRRQVKFGQARKISDSQACMAYLPLWCLEILPDLAEISSPKTVKSMALSFDWVGTGLLVPALCRKSLADAPYAGDYSLGTILLRLNRRYTLHRGTCICAPVVLKSCFYS